jgi:hypothetical protein
MTCAFVARWVKDAASVGAIATGYEYVALRRARARASGPFAWPGRPLS